MIRTKFKSSPLRPCCSCTAGLLTTPLGIQSGALLNLIFLKAALKPHMKFLKASHWRTAPSSRYPTDQEFPLLSHPRLARAHSGILPWDVAAAGTESSAPWSGLVTLGSLRKGTHCVRRLQACPAACPAACPSGTACLHCPCTAPAKRKPGSKRRASILSQCWAS